MSVYLNTFSFAIRLFEMLIFKGEILKVGHPKKCLHKILLKGLLIQKPPKEPTFMEVLQIYFYLSMSKGLLYIENLPRNFYTQKSFHMTSTHSQTSSLHKSSPNGLLCMDVLSKNFNIILEVFPKDLYTQKFSQRISYIYSPNGCPPSGFYT